ncbi:hypothetical protein AALP_AAs50485U000100 [Arabis alpina]|uniref:Uncharacterized protein n=1 Tax=Arabis alpina TaxID=50452 RepID=A0A087G1U1_ARAAL|nr:hypothetical protein AALP_AAs50485U000100 [Arabis alpina]
MEQARTRPRNHIDERRLPLAPPRLARELKEKVEEEIASSSKPKPVRRDLLAELETSRSLEVEPPITKPSTKEWVRRTFRQADISDETHPNRNNGEELQTQPELKRSKVRAPWYRTTVKEAAIANEVFSQTAKWQAAEDLMASEKEIETLEAAEREDKRSPSRVSSTGLLDFGNGPEIREAQQAEASVEIVDQQSTTLSMGLFPNFSPNDIISPLKGLVKTDRKNTQRKHNSLGVRKKIAHSPFHGNRVHQHIALAALETSNVLADVFQPSSSKTDPGDGEISKEPQGPVVQEKPPADA